MANDDEMVWYPSAHASPSSVPSDLALMQWRYEPTQTHCLRCHHVWIGQAVIPPGWTNGPITPDCPKCGCEWTQAHAQHDWQAAFDSRYAICAICHQPMRCEMVGGGNDDDSR